MLEVAAENDGLIEQELSKAKIEFSVTSVGTQAEYVRELAHSPPDIILADCSVSKLDLLKAFRLLNKWNLGIPFVLVGPMNLQLALECLKKGVDDYVLNSTLERLPPALIKALKRKQEEREREQALTALRRKEELYRLIAENTRDLICLVDRSGHFIYASPSFREVLGYEPSELVGRDSFLLVHPDDREATQRLFWQSALIKDRQPAEYRCQHKNGQWYCLESMATWIHDQRGKPQRAVIISRDITERRHLEEQLRQSQKMEVVGRLAGGVAHDFNNILTAILGYSELLLSRFGAKGAGREELEQIAKAAERATALTRQLQVFSRKQALQPRVLNLNELVANIEKMLRRLIGEDIQLTTVLGPALGNVRVDPGQIEQVIMNLAVNARDAMGQGGKLIIETANTNLDEGYAAANQIAVRPGPYVMLAISDTGCGMNADVRSHLFEPFFTTKERDKGTGFGLFTVYGIVKQSGGDICVYSEPGQGTTFKIYLPQVEEAILSESQQKQREKSEGSETLLVVEDEEIVRRLTCQALRERGYQVLEAASGETALQLCDQHQGPIHLVITDVVMYRIGGRELAERLISLRPSIKVLYISGYTDNVFLQQGVLEPGVAFLEKPFTSDALTRKVREVLDAIPVTPSLLTVCGDDDVRNQLHQTLQGAGYKVFGVTDARHAIDWLRERGVDLLIVELITLEGEGLETIRSLKTQQPDLKIVAISGALGGQPLPPPGNSGAEIILQKPFGAEEILGAVRSLLGGGDPSNRKMIRRRSGSLSG
jgi:PAS domain S-box-containing protein